MKRSSSLGSSGVLLCSFSAAAVNKLILDDYSAKQSNGSRGMEVNAGDSFGLLSQTVGCESTETSSSLVGQALSSAKFTDRDDSMEPPRTMASHLLEILWMKVTP
jgi:hypothetical protein